jgi:hypothetical protein
VSLRRDEEVFLVKNLGYAEWKKQLKEPGRRWVAEIVSPLLN